AYGGFYSTHMRTESDGVMEAIEESIAIGRGSGLPVQISHHKVAGVSNWGRSEATLARLEKARREGLDVTPDQYPYTASCARAGTLLPRWVCAGGDAAARARLADPATRQRLRAEVVARYAHVYGNDLSRIRIASSSTRPDLVGKTFADIAAARGARDVYGDMADVAMELAGERPASCDTMCIFHTMDEADVVRILRDEHTIVASDGWGVTFGAGHPHPRLYGTFPRVLGRYCREQGLFSLEEAVRRMTAMPAARLGLRDRGVLRRGAMADITVFDPLRVVDRASFDEPHRYAEGIAVVIVNGTVVLEDGTHTGALPGVFLERPA
ncbi:MAG: amidohydrolase family protein, partial [Lentisphaerae bacterium]|nr:amidohydrolase family protein [Lentisphaerota bacterium]